MEDRPYTGGSLPANAWTAGAAAREFLRYAAYPILLLSAVWLFTSVLRFGWDRGGRAVQLFLVGTIVYLAVLERLIPHRTDWHPSGRELCWYTAYFGFTMVGAARPV
ncbi:C4-dicarboxylate ABC transporter, partial [Streptomyces sp. SID7803]|nr:C4-dicarboxylate ABC transporter [Streptomyces sp. SID7803]